MLKDIKSPSDLRGLSVDELGALAAEIRAEIIDVVSRRGGHLASNLGTVELTLALHFVFNCPTDSFVFDVGHQCYTHKLLTGRAGKFDTLRQFGGLSGFTCRDESEYDAMTAGHSGTSVSAALGIAEAKAIKGDDSFTVALLGDGSLTNGMIHEALNCCAGRDVRLIIVLNDNGMSISENVGGLSDYLTRIRTSEKYFSLKCLVKKYVGRIPIIGKGLIAAARCFKNALKRMLISSNIFEDLGLEYLGPVSGGDIGRLISVFEEAKSCGGCTVVHVMTRKGSGYPPAEMYPEFYHSVSPFVPSEGDPLAPGGSAQPSDGESFTGTVARVICDMGRERQNICAVCAAMPTGTGLDRFANSFPRRFFDVGIAEENAVTFSAGLAAAGYFPVCAMYSTFAQRVYDQLWHDCALQRLPMTLLLSHAGLVPGDGVTHQGIFDAALFSSIPGVNIYSPDSCDELASLMRERIPSHALDIIRYPKGAQPNYDRSSYVRRNNMYLKLPDSPDAVIVTYGRITSVADGAADLLCGSGFSVGVVRLVQIEPIDSEQLYEAVKEAKLVYLLEEGIRRGGVGEHLEAALAELGFSGSLAVHAVDNKFIPHGSLPELYRLCGFTDAEVARRIRELLRLK